VYLFQPQGPQDRD